MGHGAVCAACGGEFGDEEYEISAKWRSGERGNGAVWFACSWRCEAATLRVVAAQVILGGSSHGPRDGLHFEGDEEPEGPDVVERKRDLAAAVVRAVRELDMALSAAAAGFTEEEWVAAAELAADRLLRASRSELLLEEANATLVRERAEHGAALAELGPPPVVGGRVLGGREAARALREELERLREVLRRCAALSQDSAESEFEEVRAAVREVSST